MGKRNISANVHLDSMVINVNVSVRLIYHKLQFSWLDFFNFLNKEISCYMEASMGTELAKVVNCKHLLSAHREKNNGMNNSTSKTSSR